MADDHWIGRVGFFLDRALHAGRFEWLEGYASSRNGRDMNIFPEDLGLIWPGYKIVNLWKCVFFSADDHWIGQVGFFLDRALLAGRFEWLEGYASSRNGRDINIFQKSSDLI